MLCLEIPIEKLTDELLGKLWLLGTLGVLEESKVIKAYFEDQADVTELTEVYSANAVRLDPEPFGLALELPEPDPVYLGQRFVVGARSASVPPDSGRFRLEIANSAAFGSGRHESTQLMVTAIEQNLAPGNVVLDVGSGSGILSLVCGLFNAKTVLACDTHLDSAILTAKHAPSADVFVGSVDAIASHSFDLVLANISASVIDLLAFHLARVTSPGGLLILSGFLSARVPKYLSPEDVFTGEDWQCWVCRPESFMQQKFANDFPSLRPEIRPFSPTWW